MCVALAQRTTTLSEETTGKRERVYECVLVWGGGYDADGIAVAAVGATSRILIQIYKSSKIYKDNSGENRAA